MSIGLYQHPHFGLVRRYILNNKHILQSTYDYHQHRIWTKHYESFSAYLKTKKIQFVLLPEEVYLDSDNHNEQKEEGVIKNQGEKLMVIYEHYPLTLGEELRKRIKNQTPFALVELWYILYCLVQGAQELCQLHSLFIENQPIILHPETILLNELGFIKLLCFYSSPVATARDRLFQTPTQEPPSSKKILLQSTYAVGRVMASLMLFKQLNAFCEQGVFNQMSFQCEFNNVKQKYGILGNIVSAMLQGIPQQRILVHEIAALLFSYEDNLLKVGGFRLDRQQCRESMVNILTGESDVQS